MTNGTGAGGRRDGGLPSLLLVGATARVLVQSAARAGLRAAVVDWFGDEDTVASAAAARRVRPRDGVFPLARLLAAARRICPPHTGRGLVYGAGFEADPALLAALARGRRLYGNSPERVAAVKDPLRLADTLTALGIPTPAVAAGRPGDPASWLAKRPGGAGGHHVRPAEEAGPGAVYQRRVAGRVLSVLFLADGRRARVVGFNEQWTAAPPAPGPYAYGGAVSAPRLPVALERGLREAVEALVEATGLRGLNGIDLVADGDRFWVLEVNPRPCATMELHEPAARPGLLQAHLAACDGEWPVLEPVPGVRAHAVVYTREALQVRPGIRWPSWIRDRPVAGTRLAVGEPLCSVHQAGPEPGVVVAGLARRVERALALCAGRGPRRLPAGEGARAAIHRSPI